VESQGELVKRRRMTEGTLKRKVDRPKYNGLIFTIGHGSEDSFNGLNMP
jgi:hypothetical protein